MFENLKDRIRNDNLRCYESDIERLNSIKTIEELNKAWPSWMYKGTLEQQKAKHIKRIEKLKLTYMETRLFKVEAIENAPDFEGEFVITVSWIKSPTWGYNPRAETSTGREYKSISGCGYDKLSTATGEALADNYSIMKVLYALKDANPDLKNNDLFGYGAGYGILPYFEGGVGIDCHVNILKKLGFDVHHINNKNTDVLIIKR